MNYGDNYFTSINTKLRTVVYYTDCKSVSIRLSKPKKEEMTTKEYQSYLQQLQFEEMYGIDPGVNSMITATRAHTTQG